MNSHRKISVLLPVVLIAVVSYHAEAMPSSDKKAGTSTSEPFIKDGSPGQTPYPHATHSRKQPVSEIMTHPVFAISIASLMLLVLIGSLTRRRKQGNTAEINHSNTSTDSSHATLRDNSRFTGINEYDITGKRTLIGRLPREITTRSCIIVINHPSIGRDHATIKYQNNGYWVHDSGTVNGTYINGKRLHDTIELKNGDKIRFGRFEFDARLPGAAVLENGSTNG